jgi:endonuclease/exonuclease/phosphatase family metal-dependent hydrolase
MSGSALVVLTQNAWGGAPLWAQRREILARAIAALAPDVVGLQEIHAPSRERGETGSQAHELADLAGGYSAWFAPGRVTAGGHCEGVALLVKRGVGVKARGGFSLSLDASDPLEGPHQRVVLSASVERAAGVVDVHCTHLSLSKHARERTLAEVVAHAMRERERSGSLGAMLVGDFNATPEEPALEALEAAGWIDAWKDAGAAGRGGTWPAGLPFRRIDYVWVQPGAGWEIAECARTPVSGSDHVGLLARIRLPEPGR